MKKKNNIFMSKALAGVLSLTSIFATASVPVYAENSTDTAVKSIACLSNNNSDILVDSKLKEFNNLDKVGKYLNFDYKVPDYIKDGGAVSLIRIMKADDKNSYLQLNFSAKTDKEHYEGTQSLYEFAGDIEQNIKDIKYGDGSYVLSLQISKEDKTLGSVNGMYVILNADLNSSFYDKGTEKDRNNEYSKFFVFTKDGVNYAVDTTDFDGEDDLNTEINKIDSSLKSPCDAEASKYVVDEAYNGCFSLEVYDKDDLNKATEYLGYTPKFLPEISDDIKIVNCEVYQDDYNGSKMTKFQCNYSYKNDGVVVFIQEKGNDNYGYKDVATNGYVMQTDYENNTSKKVPVEKLNWNNVDVYKYFDDCDNKYIYQWKIGNMYYFFEIYFGGEKENVDTIAKTLFDS
ncbi:MAG TPA: hypothetical protein DG753_01795 [Clostridium sp.]|nr:hypothetical protein [Clostridium sp.]